MMPVWQEDRTAAAGSPKRYRAQSVRADGHRAELFTCEDGAWSVEDLCDHGAHFRAVASGRAANLDAAQLIARLVWELSA